MRQFPFFQKPVLLALVILINATSAGCSTIGKSPSTPTLTPTLSLTETWTPTPTTTPIPTFTPTLTPTLAPTRVTCEGQFSESATKPTDYFAELTMELHILTQDVSSGAPPSSVAPEVLKLKEIKQRLETETQPKCFEKAKALFSLSIDQMLEACKSYQRGDSKSTLSTLLLALNSMKSALIAVNGD